MIGWFCLVLALGYHLWSYLGRSGHDHWRTVAFTSNGQWLLGRACGDSVLASLNPKMTILGPAIFLNFMIESNGYKVSLILLPDSVNYSDYRRLRAYLFSQERQKID